MSLHTTVQSDLAAIMSDTTAGPGRTVVLTDPDNRTRTVTGISNDISQVIDPETGVPVSGRSVVVSFLISDLIAAGFAVPVGVADEGIKPWRAGYTDLFGTTHRFKILHADPDRTLGIVICTLGVHCD